MKRSGWCFDKYKIIFLLHFLCLGSVMCFLHCILSYCDLYPSPLSTCKIFVLNLDSCKDRMEYISRLLDEKGLQFERISAIDGNALSFYDTNAMQDLSLEEACDNKLLKNKRMRVVHREFPKSGFIFDYSLKDYYLEKFKLNYPYKVSPGELGCHYSHRVIWQKIIDEDIRYAIVLEDDALLPDGFVKNISDLLKQMPLDADFILLERRPGPSPIMKSYRIVSRAITERGEKALCTGTCGYAVTNHGAKKLLAFTGEVAMPIDITIPMLYFDGKINHYIAGVPIVVHNPMFESVITRMGRFAWDEAMREKEGG